MKIRPLHDRVIVKRLEEDRTSPGGIVIPDTAAEKPIQGKVIAVGKGKILESGDVRPLDVKVGDKVLFGKYSGTEVKMDGDELVVMREEDMAKMKFRPLHDRVVVKRIDAESKTKGGIIIPDTAKEKPQEGEVISVGPGALDDNGKRVVPDVKAGDFVLFGKWSGTEVKIDGEELLIMKESDIMGVVA